MKNKLKNVHFQTLPHFSFPSFALFSSRDIFNEKKWNNSDPVQFFSPYSNTVVSKRLCKQTNRWFVTMTRTRRRDGGRRGESVTFSWFFTSEFSHTAENKIVKSKDVSNFVILLALQFSFYLFPTRNKMRIQFANEVLLSIVLQLFS